MDRKRQKLNAEAAEEIIFRGLIQPAFLRAGCIAAGLWIQGLMFGLMHCGMSVGVLAALPVSLPPIRRDVQKFPYLFSMIKVTLPRDGDPGKDYGCS